MKDKKIMNSFIANRIFGGLLSFAALSFPLTVLADFPDVSVTHPNTEAILYMQAEGIVDGYPDGTFRPYQTINRAEFTKIITIADNGGLPNQGARACFKDVKGDEWYAAVVCWALGYNAISGYPDGTFRPANTINFAEAAKIIVNIFDPNGMSPVPANEPWYRPFVQYLGEKGAIPTSINSLDQLITRGEMSEIVYRLQANITYKASRRYEDFASFSGLISYSSEELGIIFDCPNEICSAVEIDRVDHNSWSMLQRHPCPNCEEGKKITSLIVSELDETELDQHMKIVNNGTIISNTRTNQGGKKIIFETRDIAGEQRSAIVTCGSRSLLFRGVHIELEGQEVWDIVQRMIDNLRFTRC